MVEPHEVALYLIAGGGFLFYKGFRAMWKNRIMKSTPTSTIRSLAMGLCEVKGVVCESEEPLIAPISKKECVYYHYQIQERRTRKNRSYWATIRSGHEGRYMYIRDDTGTVLVDLEGAKINISGSVVKEVHSKGSEVEEFLESKGIDYTSFLGIKKRIRVRESVIYPHQSLYVLGTAKDNPYVEDASVSEGHKDVMISKGTDEKTFMISDRREEDILRSSSRWMSGLLFGPPLIVAGLWLLIYM